MQRPLPPILAAAVLVACVSTAPLSSAFAQADAQQSYQQAKAALEAGQFTEARDLAQKAAETDPDNAEVHLLLGRAHYQLGELDEAIAAWKRTLQLAPQQSFAIKMLAALRGETVEIDARIKFVELMLHERLYGPALQLCNRLFTEEALGDPQRVKLRTLWVELLVRTGKYADAQKGIQQLLTLDPQQVDQVQATLLLGQAKLRGDERAIAEGLALLRKVVAEHAGTPAAATASYELIALDLRGGVNSARANALADWLAANPDHHLVDRGRGALLDAYLGITRQGAAPTAKSDLSPTDLKALALVAGLYAGDLPVGKADTLTKQLLDHVKAHYVNHGAHAAAVKAAETLLAAPLPSTSRLPALKASGFSKYQLAMRWLGDQSRAGKLPQGVARGQLPQPLAEVVKVYETIRKEFPSAPPWVDQAKLAADVRGFSQKVLPLAEFQGLKGPDAWALDLALPVVKANGNAAAVKSAAETAQAIIQERAKLNKPGSRKLAVGLSTELLQAISDDHPSWAAVIVSYYTVMQNYMPYVFQENIKAGRAAENAKLSEVQKAYLATLGGHLSIETRHAPFAVKQLAEHVQPWVEHGHWEVAEQAYAAVVDALPENQRRQADLAVVQLWIGQVTREHHRLGATGLTVPRQLDPTLAKALARCCELQAGLDEEPSVLGQVRSVWDSIINHYRGLDYYDVAEAAIQVKAEKAVDAADEYAAFRLVLLQDEQARRGLARFLKQYGAAEKIALGPEFEKVIAGYTKFIAGRPTSTLVPQATEKIFAVGQFFEQHGAHAVAAGVYGDFAKFAAGVAVLSDAAPATVSTAERAALAVAAALDARARKALQETLADRKSDDPPPAKLSEEFAAAVAAYKAFIEAHPKSPQLAETTAKVMAVAYEYAKVDAWDVADSVYADLLSWELSLRRPQRLEFARGLCQLGRAMPDHARQVLSALTAGGLRGTGTPTDPAMLAMMVQPRVTISGDDRNETLRTGERTSRSGPAPPAAEPSAAATQPAAATPQPGGGGFGGGLGGMGLTLEAGASDEAQRDSQLLALIRQQESNRAVQVAQLRDGFAMNQLVTVQQAEQQGQNQQAAQQARRQAPAIPVLSEAELKRQEAALDAAYGIFQRIRKDHPHTPTAEQARGEILVMVGHWRGLSRWQRAVVLARRFLGDNPTDIELPKLRLEVARDQLAWASKPIEEKVTKQQKLAEVAQRFDAARAELAKIVADFAKQRSYQQQAQWEVANSYLQQARVVASFGPTLARGQYVRAAKELRGVAEAYPGHPRLGEIPQMLWNISAELEARRYDDEAILVWNELTIYDPMHSLSQQAAEKIAQAYHQKLQRPLKAAEVYQELNFARGGNDQNLQNAIFQIGSELKTQKRWVESLHVLETFVDSFPKHPQAGQALTMVGQIHQTNEAWEDAIAAYHRVINEFENGQFVQESKWAIAECKINLSRWAEATEAYRDYVKAYAKDAKVAEANGRIDVLKDLTLYQGLVDEDGQRKAFDAQYQIAAIVAGKLSNQVKAIIEYRKVVANWPASHLADDALFEVGRTYLALGEKEKARQALLQVAERYPTSPLADDALFTVGKSYEDEATALATVTRDTTLARNKDVAQRRAYEEARDNRFRQQQVKVDRIASLKAAGKGKSAATEEAAFAANYGQFNDANVRLFAQKAKQEVEALTATQLADRQDKINAALRRAVEAYTEASKLAGADKADEALLQMATIYDQRLKDSPAAMETWLEIVRQFSGTAVAENASWRIAETYQRQGDYAQAIDAYKSYLRNYRSGARAGDAQLAVAENYEHLGKWVNAMDEYTNYYTNFPEGPLVAKAKEQIAWIKTYRL